MDQEQLLYDELSLALRFLQTPEGHGSGAYGLLFDLMVSRCPNAYAEAARQAQRQPTPDSF